MFQATQPGEVGGLRSLFTLNEPDREVAIEIIRQVNLGLAISDPFGRRHKIDIQLSSAFAASLSKTIKRCIVNAYENNAGWKSVAFVKQPEEDSCSQCVELSMDERLPI